MTDQQPTTIQQLAKVINALLEQCQPNTRQVLAGNVSYLVEVLEKELKTGKENTAALEVIKAEQKEKGKGK